MKRRIIALLLTAAIVLSLVPAALGAQGTPGETAARTAYENVAGSNGNKWRLWHDEPVGSADWENRCLPIGNGTIGGLTYGEISNERLHVNEKTLWGGQTHQ